jgi:hypothetical protein
MSREFRRGGSIFQRTPNFLRGIEGRKLDETLAVGRNLEFAGKVALITGGNRRRKCDLG